MILVIMTVELLKIISVRAGIIIITVIITANNNIELSNGRSNKLRRKLLLVDCGLPVKMLPIYVWHILHRICILDRV